MRGLVECANVPRAIKWVVTSKMATLHELDTIYGLQDLYNMVEMLRVDDYNRRLINRHRRRARQ